MHPWVWGRMRLYGVQGTQSVRADDEPETRPNHRGGGQHSTVDHHRKASKAAHFSRKSAAPRLHRRLEKILPIEFFFPSSRQAAGSPGDARGTIAGPTSAVCMLQCPCGVFLPALHRRACRTSRRGLRRLVGCDPGVGCIYTTVDRDGSAT